MKTLFQFFLVLICCQVSRAQWTVMYNPAPCMDYNESFEAMEVISDDVAYAGGGDGFMIKTIDGGDTWLTLEFDFLEPISDIYFVTEEIGYASTRRGLVEDAEEPSIDGGIYKTVNGGLTWTFLISGDFLNMSWVSDDIGYAVGRNIEVEGLCRLVKTTDGGATWIELDGITETFAFGDLTDLQFLDEELGFAFSFAAGSIIRTVDGGVTWDYTMHHFDDGDFITKFYFGDGLNGFCVTQHGKIGTTEDAGVTFNYEDGPGDETAYTQIHFSDSENGFILGGHYCDDMTCGESLVFIYTTDGGESWINDGTIPASFESVAGQFYSVDVTPSGIIFVGGDRFMKSNFEIEQEEEEEQEDDNTVTLNENATTPVSVYPNPGNGIISFTAPENVKNLEIYDIFGRLISSTNIIANSSNPLKLNTLESGVYFFKFKNIKGETVSTIKYIFQ